MAVSQHNYRESKVSSDGKFKYTSVYHKAPATFEQAKQWQEEMGGIVFVDSHWYNLGQALYKVEDDGTITFVKANWDSSG